MTIEKGVYKRIWWSTPCLLTLNKWRKLVVIAHQHKHSGVAQWTQGDRKGDLRRFIYDAVVK